MKKLNEYLSTKIKKSLKEFPESFKKDEIIRALENLGFSLSDMTVSKSDSLNMLIYNISQRAKKSNDMKYLLTTTYYNNKNYTWIRFWKGGEISEDNPIFYVTTTDDGTCPKLPADPGVKLYALEDVGGRIFKTNDFSEFYEKLKIYDIV